MGIYIKGMEMPKGGYRTVEIAFDADGHPMALCDGGDVFDVIPVPPHEWLDDPDRLEQMLAYIEHAPVSCFVSDSAIVFYSDRLEIEQAFNEWAEKNGVVKVPNALVAFLEINGLLNAGKTVEWCRERREKKQAEEGE